MSKKYYCDECKKELVNTCVELLTVTNQPSGIFWCHECAEEDGVDLENAHPYEPEFED
jgi:RNase P subunit RPR2